MPLEQLDKLIEELECSPDGESREKILPAVRAVLECHRGAFRRLLAILRQQGRQELMHRCLEDPLLENLLRGYDLVEVDLLVCAVDQRAFAFKDRCPAGRQNLDKAMLEGMVIICPCHGYRFDSRSARGAEAPSLELEVLPVTLEDGVVKIGL